MLLKYKNDLINPELMDMFFRGIFEDERPITKKPAFTPANDIVEDEDEYGIEIMLPGFNKEDFKISTEKNLLTIEGERVHDKDSNFTLKQSYYGKFKKTYTLPDEVRIDKIDAEYLNGILYVTIPKNKKKLKSRLIEVK